MRKKPLPIDGAPQASQPAHPAGFLMKSGVIACWQSAGSY